MRLLFSIDQQYNATIFSIDQQSNATILGTSTTMEMTLPVQMVAVNAIAAVRAM